MIIDIFFVILMLWGLFKGFKRGLIYSVLSLFAFAAGLILAIKFFDIAADLLSRFFDLPEKFKPIAGFIGIVIVTLLLIRLLVWMAEEFLKFTQLNIFNRIAGGLFWCMIFLFIFSISIWLLDSAEMIDKKTKEASFTYPAIHLIAPFTVKKIKELFSVL